MQTQIQKANEAHSMMVDGTTYQIEYVEDNTVYCFDDEGLRYEFVAEELDSAKFLKLMQF